MAFIITVSSQSSANRRMLRRGIRRIAILSQFRLDNVVRACNTNVNATLVASRCSRKFLIALRVSPESFLAAVVYETASRTAQALLFS